jgi:hypothetical protein
MIDNESPVIRHGLDLDKLNKTYHSFDNFLRKEDPRYESKIKFNINYDAFEDYYKVKIYPAKKDFDSQKYFMFHFETEAGQEKIAEFVKENNVGLITY